MKRRIIFILAGLAMVSIGMFLYIDTVFLPIQFKRFVTTRAEKILRRDVSIGAIDFRFLKGFVVENITVSRKSDPNKPFIQIRQVTFNLLFAPILKKRTIIIPSVGIKDPYVYLSRDEKNIWNFSDLPDIKKMMKQKSSFAVLLRKLDLKGGEVHYSDKTQKKDFLESVEGISIDTTLSLNKGIRFVVEAQVPKRKSMLKIKGNYNLASRKLTAQVLVDNFYLAQYLALLRAPQPYVHFSDGVIPSADLGLVYQDRNFQIQGALAANKADILIGKNARIAGAIHAPNISLAWHNKKWHAEGTVQLPSAHITTGQDKEFRGDIKADLNLFTFFDGNIISRGDVAIDNARLTIGEDKRFSGNLKAVNASFAKQDGSIRLLGRFDINETDIVVGEQTSFKGNLSATKAKLTWSPDEAKARKLSVEGGLQISDAKMVFGKEKFVNGNINAYNINAVYDQRKITIETYGEANEVDILLAKDKQFQGSPYFNIFYQYDTQGKVSTDYRGTVYFTKSRMTGVPHLEEIGNIKGAAAIMPGHIQADNLTFDAQEASFELSGLLTDFSKPILNIQVSSENIKLQKILPLLSFLRKRVKVDVSGEASVDARYEGSVRFPSKAAIQLTAQLTDAALTHARLQHDITGISGRLDYENDLVTWSDLKARYKNKFYTLSGQLSNFSRPTVEMSVTSDRMALAAQIKILNLAFQLTSFTGSYLNSRFDLKGDVHLFEDTDATIDLRGKLALDLRDAGVLIPRLKNRVKQFDPTGILTGEGIFKGKLKDWRNWQLAFDAKSDRLTLNGYRFEGTSVRFAQRDSTVSKFDVLSEIYGGQLEVSASADLREEGVPFSSTINLKDLDLAFLRKDKNLKNKNLAGKAALSANLQGAAKEWRELTGGGTLSVTEGHLWQWNILDGIS